MREWPRNSGHRSRISLRSIRATPNPDLGASLEGALWFNCFAAIGEFFYHSNVRSPRWLKYVIQTPELHSIHHQLDVHRCNFGFPRDNERKLGRMLMFRHVYDS
jgi:fatty acid hydroxylase family protein